ncbi:MAG: hypothetical protein K5839_00810, partial [Treponemataceae bacterium]|nr:hypothetical protein [Treponemataceae bacterium]
LLIFAVLLTGCATTLSYTVERPAELDLNGANTISVLPFTVERGNDPYYFLGFIRIARPPVYDSKQIFANKLTDQIVTKLYDADYLQVIDSKAVESAIRNSREIPCDVYLTGYLSNWENNIESETRTNDDGSTYYVYRRDVKVTITYQIIDAATNEMISYKTKNMSASSSTYSSRDSIPAPESVLNYQINDFVSKLMKELQPYTVNVYVTLMDDPNKDEGFKTAQKLAKEGQLEIAKEDFIHMYENGSNEAGFNAAMILQTQGDLQGALNLLNNLSASFPDKKVFSAIRSIENEMQYARTLQAQKDAKASR